MSVLSQFFPSGETIKADFVLVGGGGGGGALAGVDCFSPTLAYNCARFHNASFAGGGGGGQVTVGEDYEITKGRTYSIVIGSGGAGGCLLPNPAAVISPDFLAVGPNAPFAACTAWGTPGSPGGTSFFGSVTAVGGGGGASYIPTTCTFFIPQLPAIYAPGFGCSGGSGGGNAFTGTFVCGALTGSVSVCSPGPAINNYSIGNTIKFGSPGRCFSESLSSYNRLFSPFYPVPNVPRATANNCVTADIVSGFVFASGGGGGGPSSQGGPTSQSITLTGQDIVLLGAPYSPQSSCAYSTFRGNSTGGGSASRTCVGLQKASIALDHLAGGDGHETFITGSPEIYGGGGEAFAGQTRFYCNPYVPYGVPSSFVDHTGISFNNPCYPLAPAKSRLGNGGQGGGAYRLLNVARQGFFAPQPVPYGCPRSNSRAVCVSSPCTFLTNYSIETLNCQYVLCGSVANSGGGGTSGAKGYANTTTGPCASNPVVSDGSNGSSGTFIIRYPTQFPAATVTGNTPVTQTAGYRTYKWNGPGSFLVN